MPTIPHSFCLRPLATLMLCYSAFAHAANPAASDVFQLGEIDVKSTSDQPQGFKGETISEQTMQSIQALDVGQALSNVTGVTPTMTGQRNESQVYIRGFNQNQITLNVDGIPIYVPYDGNVDLSRLLVPNLSEIVVTKGLGSLMYGPNNMGGTINLITKRPDKPLTMDASGGITANQDQIYGGNGSVQVGSRINGRWYVTGGIAYSGDSSYPLSGGFTAVAAQPTGNRLHAGSSVDNLNLKAGFTPNASDEYSFGISTVNSTKQSEPYTGNTAVTGQKVAYWDWPQWDKQSYYFIGNTALGAGYLKTRVYYDRFVNRLTAYDNATYSTTNKPFAFVSKYDDHSSGLNLEWGQPIGAEHLLKVAAFYKEDVHTEIALADGSPGLQQSLVALHGEYLVGWARGHLASGQGDRGDGGAAPRPPRLHPGGSLYLRRRYCGRAPDHRPVHRCEQLADHRTARPRRHSGNGCARATRGHSPQDPLPRH